MSDKKPKMIETRAEWEALIGVIVAEMLALRLDSDMLDAQRKAVEQKFADRISTRKASLKKLLTGARKFSDAHRGEIYGDRQSLDLTMAVVGYQKGKPTVELLEDKTDADVIAALKELKGGKEYIRTLEELNRERLLEDRDTLKPEVLEITGIGFTQAERFYVEPKLETQPGRATETAA